MVRLKGSAVLSINMETNTVNTLTVYFDSQATIVFTTGESLKVDKYKSTDIGLYYVMTLPNKEGEAPGKPVLVLAPWHTIDHIYFEIKDVQPTQPEAQPQG